MDKKLYDTLSDEKKEDIKLGCTVLTTIIDQVIDVNFPKDGSVIFTVMNNKGEKRCFVLDGYEANSPEKQDV